MKRNVWIVAVASATAVMAKLVPLWVTLTVAGVVILGMLEIVFRAESLRDGLRRIHLAKPGSD